MEKKKRACIQCSRIFTPKRNPRQQSCSNRLCQNARKSNWRRAKHKIDPDYRDNRNHACQKWRRSNPHYWKQYRATHPHYTDDNRDKQRQCKQALGKKSPCGSQTPQFANRDAYPSKNPVQSGTYHLIPASCHQFANRDALIVKISVITTS